MPEALSGLGVVGVVGVGQMGGPMAMNLAHAACRLRIYDRDPDRCASVAKHAGVHAASSLAELAEPCDVVIMLLPDGDVVRQVVLEEDDAVVRTLQPGAIVIDMGSSDPAGTRAVGQMLTAHGIAMVDAPVSGGVARAESGELSILVGGESETVMRCRPLFEVLGSQYFHLGPLGSGHAVKALNNLLSATGLLAALEVVRVAERLGLDPGLVVEVLNASTGRNNSTERKLKQFVLSQTYDSGFGLGLMVKDLRTAIAVASDLGSPTPLGSLAFRCWSAAAEFLPPDVDHTAIAQWLDAGAPDGQSGRAG